MMTAILIAAIGVPAKAQTVLTGTYSGTNTFAAGSYSIAPSGSVTLTGGYVFQAASTLTLGNYATLNWNQVGTLTGTTVTLGSGTSYGTISIGNGDSLTLASTTSLSGDLNVGGTTGSIFINNGTITQSTGAGYLSSPTFTNNGTITASPGTTLTVGYYYYATGTTNSSTGVITANNATIHLENILNQGTLNATNGGILEFEAPNNFTANLGNVTLASGGRALLQGVFDNTTGSATLTAPTGGIYELYGGTINGGTIAAGALGFTGSGGILNNVSYTGDVNMAASTAVTFTGTTNLTGTNLTLGNYATLNWNEIGTLTGKVITLGSGTSYGTISIGNGDSLTLASTTSLSGDLNVGGTTGSVFINNGTITQSTGTGYLSSPTFTNNGTITASPGTTLTVGYYYYATGTTNGSTGVIAANNATIHLENILNQGTLNATNGGILEFEAPNNFTANLGNVTLASGGRALLQGVFDNTTGAATLTAPTGGTFELYGGTINGGTIAAGALTFTNSGGTLNNVSYSGDMNVAASTSVTFTGNGTNLTGTNLTLGAYATLNWSQIGSLTGKVITLGSGTSYGTINIGNGDSLTLGSGTTMSGDLNVGGTTGSILINNGTITQGTGTGYLSSPTFTNNGTITANPGTTLTVGYYYYPTGTTNGSTGVIAANGSTIHLENLLNQGTLNATNSGILEFEGPNNFTANLGSVTLASGGRALLQGTFDNTTGTATLNAPTGGTYELYGGTINGGTIAAGALTFTNYGGTVAGAAFLGSPLALPASTSVTLSNDTLPGDVTLGASATLALNSGTVFGGTNLTLGNYASLNWNQIGTLTGKVITLGSGTSYGVINIGNADSLTLASTTTMSGDVNVGGTTGSILINNGTVTQSTGTGYLSSPTFTNNGTITASPGTTLTVGYYYYATGTTNGSTGVITANNATIHLENLLNQGTLNATNGGILEFEAPNNFTANLGTVSLASGGRALLQGTFDNTTGTATLNAPTGGTYELYGGTINGGTIAAGALTFTNYGGTIAGATLLDSPLVLPASTSVTLSNDTLPGDISLGASATLALNSGTVFGGTNLTLGNYATLNWNQVGTLTGKVITLGSGTSYGVINIGNSDSLTLASGTTMSGDLNVGGTTGSVFINNGTITQSSGTGYLSSPAFTNNATITANPGTTLTVGYYYYPTGTTNGSTGVIAANGSTIHLENLLNQGTLNATNSGILEFEGPNNFTANLGSVTLASGGRALLQGTFDNTTGTATLNAPTGGTYELYGGTINGGTIAAGALTFTNYGGTVAGAAFLGSPFALPASTSVTLSNDTLPGDVTLGASATLALNSGTVFGGTNLTLGNYATLNWNQIGTLTGKVITLGSGTSYGVINIGNSDSLTLASTTTMSGDVNVGGTTGSIFINNGTITQSTGTGYLSSPTFTNNGTITASPGTTLTVGYYYYPTGTTNGSTGVITANNATIHLENILNQGALNATNGGILEFEAPNNFTANLGTVSLASGGRALLQGTFDNTTGTATLNAPTGGPYELYGGTITGGTIAAGALSFTGSGGTLNNVNYTGNFNLPASSYVTLTGGTAFTGASASLGDYSTLYWNENSTLSGKAITSGVTPGYYANITVGTNNTLTLGSTTTLTGTIYLNGYTGSALINQGTITQVSGSGYLYVPSFTNSGVLDVQGGSLGNYTTLLTVAGGTLKGAGTISSGTITFTGGTLAPGETTGNLTLYNNAFSVTGPTVLALNLSGGSANELILQYPTGPVNIGSGLLSISLNLLSAPYQGTVYPIVSIAYGGSGITGTFAGLPVSGSSFSANYLGTPYLFSVTYGTNLITLTAVPEPTTTGLLGCGLVLLGVSRWRLRRRRS